MPVESVPESNDYGTRDTIRAGDVPGYVRVSTNDRKLEGKRAWLIEADASRALVNVIS